MYDRTRDHNNSKGPGSPKTTPPGHSLVGWGGLDGEPSHGGFEWFWMKCQAWKEDLWRLKRPETPDVLERRGVFCQGFCRCLPVLKVGFMRCVSHIYCSRFVHRWTAYFPGI